jgi:hypothetical protein
MYYCCARSAAEGGSPITGILIPGQEVVFSVHQLNERAGIPFSRIVEAVAIAGDYVD